MIGDRKKEKALSMLILGGTLAPRRAIVNISPTFGWGSAKSITWSRNGPPIKLCRVTMDSVTLTATLRKLRKIACAASSARAT